MKTKKNPATNFLNLGNQIRIPAAICNTPKTFQTVIEMLSVNEQGGSKNDKNLSNPIMKKRRLQMAVIMFITFISMN